MQKSIHYQAPIDTVTPISQKEPIRTLQKRSYRVKKIEKSNLAQLVVRGSVARDGQLEALSREPPDCVLLAKYSLAAKGPRGEKHGRLA